MLSTNWTRSIAEAQVLGVFGFTIILESAVVQTSDASENPAPDCWQTGVGPHLYCEVVLVTGEKLVRVKWNDREQVNPRGFVESSQ